GPYAGSLAYLLPFVEQDNVYKQLVAADPGLFQPDSKSPAWAYGYGQKDFQDDAVPPSLVHGTGRGYPLSAHTPISVYRCPADPGVRAAHIIDGGMFNTRPPYGFFLAWDWVCNIDGYGAELGRSNYVGVMGGYGKVEPNDPSPNHQGFAPFT